MNKEPIASRVSPIAILLVGILAVSTASIFIRFAQMGMPSIIVAAGRMVIASLLLAPFVLRTRWKIIRKITIKEWLLLLLAGLFLGCHFAAWITSLEYTSVASSVVFVTTAPLWVAILSPVLLKENLTKWVVVGLLISLAGSMVVALSSTCQIIDGTLGCSGLKDIISGQKFLGNILALIGAFLSAGYLIVGRKVRSSLDLSTYTFLVYSLASLVLLAAVSLSGERLFGYPSQLYLWLLALALIPQMIGHTAFNWALKYLSAAYVSIALLGEPVGTVILAFLFLKEKPTIFEIVGGVMILSGIAVATLRAKPQSTATLVDGAS